MQKLSNSQTNPPVNSLSYRPPPLSRALVTQSISSIAAPNPNQQQQQQTAQQAAVATTTGASARGGGAGVAPSSLLYSGVLPPYGNPSFSFSPPPAIAALTANIVASSGSSSTSGNNNSNKNTGSSGGGGSGSSGGSATALLANYNNLGFRGDLATLVKACEGIGQNAYSLEMAFVMVAVNPHLSEAQRTQFMSIVDVSLCQMLGRLRNLRERREALSAFSEAVFLGQEQRGKWGKRKQKEGRKSREVPVIDSTLDKKKVVVNDESQTKKEQQQFDNNPTKNATPIVNKAAATAAADDDSFSSHSLAKALEGAVITKQGKGSERQASPQILERGQERSGFTDTSENESGGGGGGGGGLGFSLNSPVTGKGDVFSIKAPTPIRQQNQKEEEKKEKAGEEEEKKNAAEEGTACTTAAAVTKAKENVISTALPTTTPYERQVLIVRQLLELHAAHNVFMRQHREREKEKARLRAGGGESSKDIHQTTSKQSSHQQREKSQKQQQQQNGGGGSDAVPAAALTTPTSAPQTQTLVQASGVAAVTAPPTSSFLSSANAPNASSSSSSSSRIASSAAQQLLITQTVRLLVYGYVLSPNTTNTATATTTSSNIPSLPTAVTVATAVAGGAAGADTPNNSKDPLSSTTQSAIPPTTPTEGETAGPTTGSATNKTTMVAIATSAPTPTTTQLPSSIRKKKLPSAASGAVLDVHQQQGGQAGENESLDTAPPTTAAERTTTATFVQVNAHPIGSTNTNNNINNNIDSSGPNHNNNNINVYYQGYYFTAFPSPVVALMPIRDIINPPAAAEVNSAAGRATYVPPFPVSDFTTEDTLLRRLYRLPLAILASAAATFGFATPRLIVDGVTMPPPTKATSKLRGALEIELIYSEYLRRDGRGNARGVADPTFTVGGRREGGGDDGSSVAALSSTSATSEEQYQHPNQGVVGGGGAKKNEEQNCFPYPSQHHHSVILTHLPSPAATAYFTQNATAEMRQRALLAMAATIWVNNAIEKGVRLAEAAAADLDRLLTEASTSNCGGNGTNEGNGEERTTGTQPLSSCAAAAASNSLQQKTAKGGNCLNLVSNNTAASIIRAGEERGEEAEAVPTSAEVVRAMGAFTSPSPLPFSSHPYPDLSPSLPPPPTAVSSVSNATTPATASTVAAKWRHDTADTGAFGASVVSQEGGEECRGIKQEGEGPLLEEAEATLEAKGRDSEQEEILEVGSMTNKKDDDAAAGEMAEADGGIGGNDVGVEGALSSREKLGKPRGDHRSDVAAVCTTSHRKRRCGNKAARRQLRLLMEIADSATMSKTSSISLRNLKEASFHDLFTSNPCVPQANTPSCVSSATSTAGGGASSSSAFVLPIPRLEALIRAAPTSVDYLLSQQCAEMANLVFRAVSTTVDLLIPAAAGGGGSGGGGEGSNSSSNNHRAAAVILYRKWIYDLLRAVTDYEDCPKDTTFSLDGEDGDTSENYYFHRHHKKKLGESNLKKDLSDAADDETTKIGMSMRMGEINRYYLKLIERHTNTNTKTAMSRLSSSSSPSSIAVNGSGGGTMAAEKKSGKKGGRRRAEHEVLRDMIGIAATEGEPSHDCKTQRKRKKKSSSARGGIVGRAQQEKQQQQQHGDTWRCEEQLWLDRHLVCPGVVTNTAESNPVIISSSDTGGRPLVSFRPIFLGSSSGSGSSSESTRCTDKKYGYHHHNNLSGNDNDKSGEDEEKKNSRAKVDSSYNHYDCVSLGALCRSHRHRRRLIQRTRRQNSSQNHHHHCHRRPQCIKVPKTPPPPAEELSSPTTFCGHPTISVGGGGGEVHKCCSSLSPSSASRSPSISSSCCYSFSSSSSSSSTWESSTSLSSSCFSSSSSSSQEPPTITTTKNNNKNKSNKHHLLEESCRRRKSGMSEEILLTIPSPPRERKLTAVFLPAESPEEGKVVTKAKDDDGGIERGKKVDPLAPHHLIEEGDCYQRGGMQTPTRRRRQRDEKSHLRASCSHIVNGVEAEGKQKGEDRQLTSGGRADDDDDDVDISSHSSSSYSGSGSKTPARGRASAQAPQGETPPPTRKRQQRDIRSRKEASSPTMPPASSSAATAAGNELGLVSSRPSTPPRQIFGLTTPRSHLSPSYSREQSTKMGKRETRQRMKSKRKGRQIEEEEAALIAAERKRKKALHRQSRVAVATRMLLSLALPTATATHNKTNSNASARERRRNLDRCDEGVINPTHEAEVSSKSGPSPSRQNHMMNPMMVAGGDQQPSTESGHPSSLLSPSLFHFHSYRQISVRSRDDVAAGYAAVLAEAATALHPAHPVRAALVNNAADHLASSLGKINDAIKLIESFLAELSSEALLIYVNSGGGGEGVERGGACNSGSSVPAVGVGDNNEGMFVTSSTTGVGGGSKQALEQRNAITTNTIGGAGATSFAENSRGLSKATRFEGDASGAASQSSSPICEAVGGAVAVAGVTMVPPSVLSSKRREDLNDPSGKTMLNKTIIAVVTSDSQTLAATATPRIVGGNSAATAVAVAVAANIAGSSVTAPAAGASPSPSVSVGVGTTVASAVMRDVLVVVTPDGRGMMRAGGSTSSGMTATTPSSVGIVSSAKTSSSSPEKSGVVVGVGASSTSTSPAPQGAQKPASATPKTKSCDALPPPPRISSGASVIIPIESLSASAAAAAFDDTSVASRGAEEVQSLSMPVGGQQKKSAFTTSSAARGVGASPPPFSVSTMANAGDGSTQNAAAKVAASTTATSATALVVSGGSGANRSREFGDAGGGTLFLTAAAVGVLDEELMETKFILRMLTQSLGVLKQLI